MTRLTLSFPDPQAVVLTAGPSLSLAFPDPQAVVLQVQGIQGPSGGGGGALTVQDEGVTLSSAVSSINFTGSGVTATGGTSVTVNIPGGGGGVTDGDKGDITVSGGGTVWTIDAGAVTLSDMANLATSTILGRATAGTGVPEALTPAQVRTVLGLATIATSGSASDLGAGTLPAARFDDTAHGARAGGTLHANVVAAGAAGFMTGADKTKLDGIATGATANATDAALRDRTTHTGTQTASTISDFNSASRAQTEAELIAGTNITITPAGSGATRTLTIAAAGGGATNLTYDAPTREVRSDTGTDAVLPLVSSANAGLAPASGGGTANFLRADGTWVAPGGSGDMVLASAQTNSGLKTFLDGSFGLRNVANSFTSFLTNTNTAARTYTLKDANGTLAFTSDITGTNSGTNTGDVTLAGTPNYLTIAGQVITRALIDLATHVTGKLPFANIADMATGTLFYRKTAGSGAPETQTLATLKTDLGLTGTNSGDQTITLTGDVGGSGTGSFAATIAADAVTNAKLANMATATIKGRVTAATGDPEDLTGTQATALLDTFTSTLKGLAPASGGGTTNFLRADGTWAAAGGGSPVTVQDEGTNITTALGTLNFVGAGVTVTGGATATVTIPGGGGSPGGASGEVQFNNAGAFGGAADVEIEGGQLRLPAIAPPTAPAAGGLKMFARNVGGRILPATMGPSGLDSPLQPHLALNGIAMAQPRGNSTGFDGMGLTLTATGTATAKNFASTNLYTQMRGLNYLVTVAAVNAIAGFRAADPAFTVGGNLAEVGGFHYICRWGPATGVATATTRAFVGLWGTATAPTDVEPSTLLNIVGMGWDAADTNIQFMHNDGSGACTKIDLGASFPVPTVDATDVYEIAMFSPPGTTQSVSYRIRNLRTAVEATGTVTTNLPLTTQGMRQQAWMSVGGTSSVIGITLFKVYIETDY